MVTADRTGYVYVIQDGAGLCKIGRAKDVKKRLQTLSTASSSPLTLIAFWECENAGQREATMHEFWSDVRVRGEWFRIPDNIVEAWKLEQSERGDETGWTPSNENETAWDELSNGEGEKRAKQIRVFSKPGEDGRWWIATKHQEIDCPRCGRMTLDKPAVMRYDKQRDWGGLQARCYPEWPRLGWLIWRECQRCSWMDAKTEYRTLQEIMRWNVGPWRPNA